MTADESGTSLSIRGALQALSSPSGDQTIHFSSDSPEWYTPAEVLQPVERVLERIDLDPCSNTRGLADIEQCSSCERTGEDRHLCSCGEILCEACYDGGHQKHDALDMDRPANVPAVTHYIRADDGLSKDWQGRVFMNPPYGREIRRWTSKLRTSFEAGAVVGAIALVPACRASS